MKWMRAVVTFGVLVSGRVDAGTKVPPELAKVDPPINTEYPSTITFLGKRKVGTRELLVWTQMSENDTNQCCDIPPGSATFLYLADATTGARMFEDQIGEVIGDKDDIEASYGYRIAWSDLDNDRVPELVLTRTGVRGDVTRVPRELIWQLRSDQLLPVSRAQLRCRTRATTKEAADAALIAAAPGDVFCALSDARSFRDERVEAAQVMIAVAAQCPTDGWWHRNDPRWIGDSVPVTVYVLRDGSVYSESATRTDVEIYKPDNVRVVDLQLVRNGDRPFLALETVTAGKHRVVVIDPAAPIPESGVLPAIVDEPLSPGERITVHDFTIAVGPAKGAVRKQWTYDPAADAWQ